MGELAFDEGQRLATLLVEAATHDVRRSGEPRGLEVAQESVHRRCPRACLAVEDVSAAVDLRPAAAPCSGTDALPMARAAGG